MMPRTGDWRGGAGPTSKTGRLREVSSSSAGWRHMLGKPIFDSNALDEDILDEDPFVTSRSSLSRTSPIAASIIVSPAAGLKKTRDRVGHGVADAALELSKAISVRHELGSQCRHLALGQLV